MRTLTQVHLQVFPLSNWHRWTLLFVSAWMDNTLPVKPTVLARWQKWQNKDQRGTTNPFRTDYSWSWSWTANLGDPSECRGTKSHSHEAQAFKFENLLLWLWTDNIVRNNPISQDNFPPLMTRCDKCSDGYLSFWPSRAMKGKSHPIFLRY